MLPVLVDDTDPDHALADGHAGQGLAYDVVTQPDREKGPEGVPADFDASFPSLLALRREVTERQGSRFFAAGWQCGRRLGSKA